MVNKTFLIALIIIILDRVAKLIFFDNSSLNKGAAFSILPGFNWLFILVALIVIVYIFIKRNEEPYQIGMGFLLGGTIGNLIDRIFYDGVIDFISFLSIPKFNISDVSNIIGALLIIYMMNQNDKLAEKIRNRSKSRRKE